MVDFHVEYYKYNKYTKVGLVVLVIICLIAVFNTPGVPVNVTTSVSFAFSFLAILVLMNAYEMYKPNLRIM